MAMLAASHGEEYERYHRRQGLTVAEAVRNHWGEAQPQAQASATSALSFAAGIASDAARTLRGAASELYEAGWGLSHKLRNVDATTELSTTLGRDAAGVKDEDKALPGGVDPEKEGHPDDLVLESWAHCVSKAKYAPSQDDYVERAQGVIQVRRRHMWRKRTSWIALDCGEDSFFVSNNRKVVGIADGVGGWRSTNIDPAEVSNYLMEYGKKLSEGDRNNTDPLDLMTQAWQEVVDSGKVRGGSTTALFATIESSDNSRAREGQARGKLRIANLGDSGLLLFRNNQVQYRARELQHRFNAPYQLAIIPRKHKDRDCISDPPSKAWQDTVDVKEDDIVLLGTDGLFDNVHNTELKNQCDSVLNTTGEYGDYYTPFGKWNRNSKGRMYAKDVVTTMVDSASLNASSRTYMTPFSYGLMEAGVASSTEARGGKPDDITVVLARVVRRKNWREAKGRGGGEAGSIRDIGGKFYGYTNIAPPKIM
eukprot:TRINITY_DN1293_c0_g1_i1.p1 TRINITY_DN1293_c0_g1~~TRINITY_DN1293_c0_g1_i1.p1  ORF type:complete len:489 (+),score=196.06 TRINITY_DN1293_c0_g1_i1:29-1468(+)